jgi:aryl-alcohol dehydrogenase-like predicted oxidoreductase
VATKLGLRSDPGRPENFKRQTVFKHTDDSLRRLGVEALDLTQTHCIPAEQIRSGQVFGHLAELKQQGKIKAFGASVESMDEALLCLEHEGLASLQIIFNIFRQKPIEVLFQRAKQRGVAIVARLPLASGVLSGKITRHTAFAQNDHRNYNRDGQCFNVGETFAGLPLETAIELTETIRPLVPPEMTMAQFALRWCLDFDAVTAVIPGAKRPEQARDNAAASELAPLSDALHERLRTLYKERVKDAIRGVY